MIIYIYIFALLFILQQKMKMKCFKKIKNQINNVNFFFSQMVFFINDICIQLILFNLVLTPITWPQFHKVILIQYFLQFSIHFMCVTIQNQFTFIKVYFNLLYQILFQIHANMCFLKYLQAFQHILLQRDIFHSI